MNQDTNQPKRGWGGARPGSGQKRRPSRFVAKPCARCGSDFQCLPHAFAKRRFCSSRCSALFNVQPRIAKAIKHIPRPCQLCGESFTSQHREQRFCGWSCAKSHLRQQGYLQRGDRRAKNRERMAARRANGIRRKPGRWVEICERDGWACHICGLPITQRLAGRNQGAPTVDHLVPLSCGGSDADSNLKAAHFGCNAKRGARTLPRAAA
jgi:5-methylcytosine-specific restriction endonuclease McrA